MTFAIASLDSLLLGFMQGLLLVTLAPGITGLLVYFKAGLQARRRSPATIWQPYRDLRKLWQRPAIRARTTSWLFALAPTAVFVAYSWLAFAVPLFSYTTLVVADFIMVIYVLGLARFLLSLAGLDAGAPFGGLGSSREMFFYFLTEVGLVLVLAALSLRWGTVSLDALFQKHAGLGIRFVASPDLILLAGALVALILLEADRIPVDNPATHLELTMSQKAIGLEYAGRDLALLEWAEMIKLAFLITLFGDLFLPLPVPKGWIADFQLLQNNLVLGLYYLLKLLVMILTLALWEMHRPKLRLRKVVTLALLAVTFTLISIIQIVGPGFGN